MPGHVLRFSKDHQRLVDIVRSGRIEGVTGLTRAKRFVAADGTFSNARFEMRNPDVKKVVDVAKGLEGAMLCSIKDIAASLEASGLDR